MLHQCVHKRICTIGLVQLSWCEQSRRSEGVAGADVLQFLGDLGRRPVQLFGHAFLLVRVHAVELLAQIAVDHILEGGGQEAKSSDGLTQL